VWVADSVGNTVVRLDPGSGQITATVRVGANPLGFALIDRELWVFSQTQQLASVIDPAEARVRRTVTLPGLGTGYPAVAGAGHPTWPAPPGRCGASTRRPARSPGGSPPATTPPRWPLVSARAG
jgi:hypothetical protein